MAANKRAISWDEPITTRAGSPVKFFSEIEESGLIYGAYWTGDVWIPVTWDYTGHYVNDSNPCSLDLVNDVNRSKQ